MHWCWRTMDSPPGPTQSLKKQSSGQIRSSSISPLEANPMPSKKPVQLKSSSSAKFPSRNPSNPLEGQPQPICSRRSSSAQAPRLRSVTRNSPELSGALVEAMWKRANMHPPSIPHVGADSLTQTHTTPQGKPKHSTSKPVKTIVAEAGNAKCSQ